MLKKLFMLMALAGTLSFAQNASPILNSSFEELNASGYPKNWPDPGCVWKSSSENAADGKLSMLYDNEIQGRYKFIAQNIKLKGGQNYEYSVMVKTVARPNSPKGKVAKPRIFLEYSDSDGKWCGGNYGYVTVDLNTDWKLIKGQALIPKNVRTVSIGLSVQPDGTSTHKVWFDKLDIHPIEPPVFECIPISDCYRDQAFEGPVTVSVARGQGNTSISDDDFSKTTLGLLLGVKTVLTLSPKSILPDRFVFQFDATALKPGTYTLKCQLTDSRTHRVHSVENTFTRLAAKPDYRVYVDKHHRLIVDGKPFFPLGMYHSTPTKDNLKAYLDSDFNCLMPYNPVPRDILDHLHANNMKLFYSIKGNVSTKSEDKNATEALQARGIAKLKAVIDHPAIIGWYINDELPAFYVQDAIDYRRKCEEADPSRPTWTVLCNPDDFRLFAPASDIHGSDPYPIPSTRISQAYAMSRRSTEGTLGNRMTIQVPQAFCWGRYWIRYGYAAEKIAACPMPTYEEMDAMAWMNIAGGANGLIFYSYFDMMECNKPNGPLAAIPFDKAFGDIKRVATRVKQHEAVLLSDGAPAPFDVTVNPDDTVCLRAYGYNGETWILAVNTSKDKDGRLELDFRRSVTIPGVSLSSLDVTVNGSRIAAVLKPIQPVFIRVK